MLTTRVPDYDRWERDLSYPTLAHPTLAHAGEEWRKSAQRHANVLLESRSQV